MAVLAVGLLQFVLPETMSAGPKWLLIVLVGVLLIPTVISHRRGDTESNQRYGYLLLAVMTLALIWSVATLVIGLPGHRDPPVVLLRGTAAIWASNVLIFASWYWRIDAGGPHERLKREEHLDGAFLFPQMTMTAEAKEAAGETNWSPGFIDYLFLAFNASTAFSPTDTPVLSRWAKVMTMAQAAISLATVVVLGARAVSIL